MTDIFARITDIKGESIDAKHKDEIEVLSFSWGVTNTGSISTGGAAATGKATFHDLSFVHRVDRASPLLMRACAGGTHIKEAILTQRKAGGGQQDYFIIKLNEVRVTSVTHGGGTGERPSESVTLEFGKVDFEYKPQKADGTLDAGTHFKFDLKTSKAG